MSQKIPVAVLAATGSVGQRFVQLLDHQIGRASCRERVYACV